MNDCENTPALIARERADARRLVEHAVAAANHRAAVAVQVVSEAKARRDVVVSVGYWSALVSPTRVITRMANRGPGTG